MGFTVVNYADELFMKVNVRLVLTHLHISEDYVIKRDANAELINFNKYREKRIREDKDPRSSWKRADVIHLMFDDDFDSVIIGMAYVSGMCVSNYSVGIGKHYTNQLL